MLLSSGRIQNPFGGVAQEWHDITFILAKLLNSDLFLGSLLVFSLTMSLGKLCYPSERCSSAWNHLSYFDFVCRWIFLSKKRFSIIKLSIYSFIMKPTSESHSVVSDSLWPQTILSWNSPGHNTGMGSRSLLQGIFPTQGSNLGLPHCRRILYQLSHKASPKPTKIHAIYFRC